MSNVSAKKVMKYAAMPGVIPRMKRLFLTSFGMIAYLLANIYGMVRLLPRGHVYLQASNIGRYGIRHVVAEAASHLEFKKQYWDRILIFVVLLSGIVMLCAQLVLLGAAVLFDPVWAQTITLSNIFSTPDPVSGTATSIDVAFLLLDRVFGIPGFFCTVGDVCTDVLSTGRWPFHVALHGMFRFYSMGLLSVAVLIFLYFIVVVVGETVTSGTPFGERFQNVWVPLRLVVALLLLTPVTYGINIGQYVALWSAKAGSGFATNGWQIFNNTLKNKMGDQANPLGEKMTLLSQPSKPDITQLIQAMLMVHGCAYAEWRSETRTNYAVPPDISDLDAIYHVPPKTQAKGDDGYYVRPYLFKYSHGNVSSSADHVVEITEETTFAEALKFYGFGNVVIHFGKKVGEASDTIEPVCGKIEIPVVDRSFLNQVDTSADLEQINQALIDHGGGALVHAYYFDFVRKMWFGTLQGDVADSGNAGATAQDLLIRHVAHRYVEKEFSGTRGLSLACKIGCMQDKTLLPSCTERYSSDHTNYPNRRKCEGTDAISVFALKDLGESYSHYLSGIISSARESFLENTQAFMINTDVLDRGWGGAGIWYNTIGQVNGNFVSAVQAMPVMTQYPDIMEKVRSINEPNAANLAGFKIFDPEGSGSENIEDDLQGGAVAVKKAKALYNFLIFVTNSLGSYVYEDNKGVSGNAFLDAVDFIFGVQGLYDMRGVNANVHPIAQLSAVGKGIVDSAIRNIGISTGLSLGGGLIASFKSAATEKGLQMAKQLFSTTAYVGLTAGVVLYYIIPILPFVFFFFAVAGWVKGLFEAMVGVPLWSLAHLRIDGEGLPGEAASSGYFLILEIFLRPILIVFGLIAAMLIFGMQTRILQVIWDLVIDNVGGAAGGDITAAATVDVTNEAGEVTSSSEEYFSISRGKVDQLFFTILYTIIVYMMATASFKLIDMIPDSIMRWAGASVSSFGDADKNPSDGLMRYAATGGMMQGQRIVGAGDQFATGLGNLTRPPPPVQR